MKKIKESKEYINVFFFLGYTISHSYAYNV